jgi:hypothetical protein
VGQARCRNMKAFAGVPQEIVPVPCTVGRWERHGGRLGSISRTARACAIVLLFLQEVPPGCAFRGADEVPLAHAPPAEAPATDLPRVLSPVVACLRGRGESALQRCRRATRPTLCTSTRCRDARSARRPCEALTSRSAFQDTKTARGNRDIMRRWSGANCYRHRPA